MTMFFLPSYSTYNTVVLLCIGHVCILQKHCDIGQQLFDGARPKKFFFSHFSLSLLFFPLFRVENVFLFEFILGIKMIVKNEFVFVRV